MVWPHFKVFWFSKDNPTGHSERTKKKRQKEVEAGRQYQEWIGMDFASSTKAVKTGQDGKGLLRTHLWCPDNLQRLWDKNRNRNRNDLVVYQICE